MVGSNKDATVVHPELSACLQLPPLPAKDNVESVICTTSLLALAPPTCALVLQALAIVALLADAVVLSRVCAALAAGHQVTAIPASFTQRGTERQIFLDVAARREVCESKPDETSTGTC